MIDINILRENPKIVEDDLRRRQRMDMIPKLKELIDKDAERRKLIGEADALRAERNKITAEIAKIKKTGGNADHLLQRAKEIPERVKDLELRIKTLEEDIRQLHLSIPNILHPSVPEGKDDKENVEMRKLGKQPKFTFTPKGHLEILQGLGMLDLERASKVAGHGFYYLKGDAAILELSLQRFALDILRSKGFTVVQPPLMISREAYEGVTSLEDFENVMYKIEGENLYLIATSEHPIASMLMNETLVMKDLPVMFAGISPCFRKEVGTHGKYTKGMFRVHNFYKIEQFIFCHPDESWKLHEKLQKNSEEIYKKLGLYYRVVNVCTGDMGDIAAKKYDIEAWMADNAFRETGSNSNCTDYQARRLGIKYREGEGKPPKDFVHTLNNTAIADRVMIALIEQFQKKDCTVTIPKVLWKSTGFKKLEK